MKKEIREVLGAEKGETTIAAARRVVQHRDALLDEIAALRQRNDDLDQKVSHLEEIRNSSLP